MGTVAKKIMMGSGAVGDPVDNQFNRVSALFHMEGSNNGVNNVFDDASTSNHTITAYGNVTQGSFSPFARPDGEWGWNFEDGDSLAVASSSDFDFGTSNFTWECFVFQKSRSAFQLIMAQDDYSTGNSISCWLTDTGQASIYYEGGGTHFTTTATVPLNTWTHLAWVRKGTGTNEFSIYINGTAEVSGTMTTSFDQDGIIIGQQANGDYDFIGNISNIRIVNGSAVYTGNFTTPTSKLTAVTNTKLLTCQSNRFVDNSASGHAITPTGTPAVTAFGPFLTSAVYDAAVNGASGYFSSNDSGFTDGTADLLDLGVDADFNFGTGDFSIEYWAYFQGTGGVAFAAHTVGVANGFYAYDNPPRFELFNGGGQVSTGETPPKNSWYFFVLSRQSGTLRVFANGVLKASATNTAAISQDGNRFCVGGMLSVSGSNARNYGLKGYLTDFRVVKGSCAAAYQTSSTTNGAVIFTPPTAPVTAVTNTKLLLNMKDGQAIDSAAQNNLTLFGNTKTSTAQYKYGTSSLLLDGTGDYAVIYDANTVGVGDFTIELWARRSATNNGGFFQFSASALNSSSGAGPGIGVFNGGIYLYYGKTGALQGKDLGGTLPGVGTWFHVAYVRSNGVIQVYVNGTAYGATTDSTVDYTDSVLTLGGWYSSSFLFHGNIDDFRISHMARYTSNFTAPTEPFADKGK